MDVNIFHPTKGQHYKVEETIKNICFSCPVSEQCLDEALSEFLQIGYRAGLSAKKRDGMIQDRKKAGKSTWKIRT